MTFGLSSIKPAIVAIDGMYFIWHSIFRAIRLWSWHNKAESKQYLTPREDGKQADLLISDTFRESLSTSVMHTCYVVLDIIEKACSEQGFNGLEIRDSVTQLFIIDDRTGNGFRRKLFPEYKMARKIALKTHDINISKIRSYVVTHLLDDLDVWSRLGYKKVFVNGAEADDIIFMVGELYNDLPVKPIIISSDKDLLQIPGVDQYNLKGELIKRIDPKTKEELTCKEFLTRKILTGDGSDNIPAIMPKCGPVKAAKLLSDKQALKESLENDPEIKQRFILNTKLIDISRMPDELRESITKTLTDVVEREEQQVDSEGKIINLTLKEPQNIIEVL